MKTLKLRIKDKHAKVLRELAQEVNFVWNYVNDLSQKNIQRHDKFLSAFDLHRYTQGASKEGLNLHSQTIQAINEEYVTRRKQFKKAKLRWRVSYGAKRSLGWIPFKASGIKYTNGQIKYTGHHFGLWDSYGLSQYKDQFKAGSFNEDARGRWYFNVVVDVPAATMKGQGTKAAGIDLGCKETATDSNGDGIHGRHYRALGNKLAKAQRANKKKEVKNIHAKIKNRRKDEQHKYTKKLIEENALIVVGNVSSSKLVKTTMAKSVLDAGWSQMKTMLEYKCHQAGVVFMEVNEAYTTVTCSVCNERTGPKGQEGLRIREWTCCACGITHNRDINAAKNILALGHERLAGGIPLLQ